MNDTKTPPRKKGKNTFAAVVATQAICISLIIAGTALAKQISPKVSKKIAGFYGSKICADTNINEFLSHFKDAV